MIMPVLRIIAQTLFFFCKRRPISKPVILNCFDEATLQYFTISLVLRLKLSVTLDVVLV